MRRYTSARWWLLTLAAVVPLAVAIAWLTDLDFVQTVIFWSFVALYGAIVSVRDGAA